MGTLGVRSPTWLALAAAASACGGERITPTTLSLSATAVVASPSAAIAPIYRGWVDRNATLLGDVPQGTLFLRGKKRWLASGSTFTPQQAPGDLDRATLVPTANAPVLVGIQLDRVVRFDDPLGAPTELYRAEETIEELGSIPGHVFVGGDDVFIDVATGNRHDPGPLLPVPPRSVAFLDVRRGGAYFAPLARFFTTDDGGTTWAPIASKPFAKGSVVSNGRRLAFDLDGRGFLDEGFPREAPPPRAGLIGWLEHETVDPLYAAVTAGVATTPGQALIPGVHWIGRVDLANGDVPEAVSTPGESCRLASTREGPIAVCRVGEKNEATVRTVHLDPLRLGGGARVDNGSALVTAPSGAVAIYGTCDGARTKRAICVRQPDGSWASVEATVPRVDGSGLEITRSTTLELVDRAGNRSALAHAPDRFSLTEVSEDEGGAVWVLARETPSESEGGRRAPDRWHVGWVEGGTIRWTALEPAADYALRGSMTIGSDVMKYASLIRARPDRPVVVIPQSPGYGELEVHELGFHVDGRAHVGFVPHHVAEAPRRDSGLFIPKRLEIDCTERGAAKPFADRGLGARSDEPESADGRMERVGDAGAHVVGWRRKGKGLEVRYLDGFAAGSPVRDARFTMPEAWTSPISHLAVVRNGRVAMTLADDHTRVLRTGTAANEIDLEQGNVEALWLGDDGALVANLFGSGGVWHHHWTPRSATPTTTTVGPVSAVGVVDARGYTVVEAGGTLAVRARVTAGGAALALGDFRRDDGFASIAQPSLLACARGATGAHFVMRPAKVDLALAGQVSNATVWLEVLLRDGKTCIARASTTTDHRLVRVDFLAGKADVVTMESAWAVRNAECHVSP